MDNAINENNGIGKEIDHGQKRIQFFFGKFPLNIKM
jgi:hypothetical protein